MFDFLTDAIASRMTEPTIQWTLASCMFLPGMTCILAPRCLLTLSLCEDKRGDLASSENNTCILIFQFFGMQACLVGTVLGTCQMTERSYRAFAAAMLPFFGINYYYRFVQPTIAPWPMLADFVNNLLMSQLALAGAKLLSQTKKNHQ